MINLFPEEKSRKDIYILDVAAGTGFVAEKLIQEGFEKFDALEPCEGLLNHAIAKGIYSKTFQTFITDTPTNIESDTYDVVTVCGGFGENHIPCSGLDEFIRLVKPGGHIVIAMSETFLTSVLEYKDRLEPRMKRLEEEGKWVSIRRTVVPRYFDVYNGVVFVFQVSK